MVEAVVLVLLVTSVLAGVGVYFTKRKRARGDRYKSVEAPRRSQNSSGDPQLRERPSDVQNFDEHLERVSTEEPAITEERSFAQEPAVTEEPVEKEEPRVTEQLAVAEEPTAALKENISMSEESIVELTRDGLSASLESFISKGSRRPAASSVSYTGFERTAEIHSYDNNQQEGALLSIPAMWYVPGAQIEVHGFDIDSGWVFVGTELPTGSSTLRNHLIDPTLPVRHGDTSTGQAVEELSYQKLTPEQRAEYLSWLAGGRRDTAVNSSLLLLFLAGLEHRVFVELVSAPDSERERDEIIDEVFRLRRRYSSDTEFVTKAQNFVAFESAKFRQYPHIPPQVQLNIPPSKELLRLIIAQTNRGVFVDPAGEVVFYYLTCDDGQYRSPEKEKSKIVKFAAKYNEKYNGGVFVGAQSRVFQYDYTPVNTYLNDENITHFPEYVDLRIPEWEEQKIYALLSSPMQSEPVDERINVEQTVVNTQQPKAHKNNNEETSQDVKLHLKSYMDQALASGVHQVVVGELLNVAEIEHANFNRKNEARLSEMIDAVGYKIVPNSQVHGVKPRSTNYLKVLRSGDYSNQTLSNQFYTAVVMVHLSVMVSRADETVLDSEKNIARMITENNELTRYEKASLRALYDWCFENEISYKGVKRNIRKLRLASKYQVWDRMVEIAVVDERLDPREIVALDKIYNLLELDPAEKNRRLAAVSDVIRGQDSEPATEKYSTEAISPEPTIVRAPPEAALDIPKHSQPESVDNEASKIAVGLDPDKLARIRKDNTEARNLFGTIFDGDEDEDDFEEPEHDDGEDEYPSDLTTDAESSLDKPHRKLLHKLIKQDEWQRDDFEALCEKLNLMPDGAIEIINDWSYKQVDAPVLEDDETIYVDLTLELEILK